MSLLSKKDNKIKFGKYSYQINFEKLREICLSSTNDLGTKEIQIVQTYDFDERDEANLSQKIEHETKTLGGNQNGMIYETGTLTCDSCGYFLDLKINTYPQEGCMSKVVYYIEFTIFFKIINK